MSNILYRSLSCNGVSVDDILFEYLASCMCAEVSFTDAKIMTHW